MLLLFLYITLSFGDTIFYHSIISKAFVYNITVFDTFRPCGAIGHLLWCEILF